MANYDFSHLTQGDAQTVVGPIQDDEALFLYAMVRGMRLRRVLELGGLAGYSATNFLKALGPHGTLYTVDLNPVPRIAENHIVITKDALHVTADDVDNKTLDMIFFDCHDYNVQMSLFVRLHNANLINDRTVLVLHDTHLHPQQFVSWAYPIAEGFVHQAVERRMVNDFKRIGYDSFSLHTNLAAHDASLPFRHGLTVCQKFKPLAV